MFHRYVSSGPDGNHQLFQHDGSNSQSHPVQVHVHRCPGYSLPGTDKQQVQQDTDSAQHLIYIISSALHATVPQYLLDEIGSFELCTGEDMLRVVPPICLDYNIFVLKKNMVFLLRDGSGETNIPRSALIRC